MGVSSLTKIFPAEIKSEDGSEYETTIIEKTLKTAPGK
jgi:hypothetical protein